MIEFHKKLTIITVAILLVLILCIHFALHECFTNKYDKATAIYNWFQKNGSDGSYIKYRDDLKNKSNIVEYNDVMNISRKHNLTLDNVKNII